MGLTWNIHLVLALDLSEKIIVAKHKKLQLASFMHVERQVVFGLITQNQHPTCMFGVVYASTSGWEC